MRSWARTPPLSSSLCAEVIMRTTFGIIFAIVAIFLAFQLVNYLPAVSRVEDLGEVGRS